MTLALLPGQLFSRFPRFHFTVSVILSLSVVHQFASRSIAVIKQTWINPSPTTSSMLHDDSLRYYLSHQVLRPSRLTHPVLPRSQVISRLHITLQLLSNRVESCEIFTDCTRVSYFEELGLEKHTTRVYLEHVHVCWCRKPVVRYASTHPPRRLWDMYRYYLQAIEISS